MLSANECVNFSEGKSGINMNKEKGENSILNKWNGEIDAFIQQSTTLCIAVYNINGYIEYANPAIKSLIIGNETETLINPTFQRLKESLPDNQNMIFGGFLTIGSIITNQSIKSKVYRKDDELLIIGEVEIEQLKKLNLTMIDLNREINNLQRRLIKEKKQLAETNKQLKSLNEEKNRILGIAAHDLRNPIGTIMGYAQLLSQKFPTMPIEDINKFLSVIIKSSKFSLTLLNDLLDISKIESGSVQLNLTKINYIDFIKAIIDQNQIIGKQKGINIKLNHETADFLATIDIQKIEQVLNNLISNAIKYSLPKTEIMLKVSVNEQFYKTEIIDQGQGIPAKELPNIFDPFQTAGVQSTAGEKSTGLGLAIAKKIIAEHGGDIFVESAEDKGSNFYFTLPV